MIDRPSSNPRRLRAFSFALRECPVPGNPRVASDGPLLARLVPLAFAMLNNSQDPEYVVIAAADTVSATKSAMTISMSRM
jgi:hypothetical protein